MLLGYGEEVSDPVSVRLTADSEALIREKVESGFYASADEVVRAAIRLLDYHDRKRQHLLALLAEGEEGEGIPYTPELLDEIDREAEERFQRGELPSPDAWP